MALKARSGGVRRFQNEDGSLTAAGKKKYLGKDGQLKSKYAKKQKHIDAATKRMKESIDYDKSMVDYWNKKAKKDKNVDDMSDDEVLKIIKKDFGNDGLDGMSDYGYKPTVKEARRFIKDGWSESYSSAAQAAKRWQADADKKQKVLDYYSDKKIYEISKTDLSNAKALARSVGDYTMDQVIKEHNLK